jgi:predicted nucleotidyltransferase
MRTSALVKTKVHPTGFPPVAKTLPKAVKRIVSELKPEKIILFGSYAYGNPTPDSDVDLLVIMQTSIKRQVDRYVLVSNFLDPRQFPVDIIVHTPAEIKRALNLKGNFFIPDIMTNGKALYERRKRR